MIHREWHRFRLHYLATVGMAVGDTLQSAQHHVGAFIHAPRFLYADKEAHLVGHRRRRTHRGVGVDWKRDKLCLVGECQMIAGVIFIQSCSYAVAVGCNLLIQAAFVCTNPVAHLCHRNIVCAQTVAKIEIRVSERLCSAAGVDPIIIHSVCTHKHPLVVFP